MDMLSTFYRCVHCTHIKRKVIAHNFYDFVFFFFSFRFIFIDLLVRRPVEMHVNIQ